MKTSFKVTAIISAIGMSIYALTEIAWHIRHIFAMDALQFDMFRNILGTINIVALVIGVCFGCVALFLYIKTKKG